MNKPNILFLMTDQQQQSIIMGETPCVMPNVERLKEIGTTFNEARTVNSICSPSRASLFTGLYPHNHGMVDCSHCVEPFRADYKDGTKMLSQIIKENGYQTGYFGKWHVERTNDPCNFGFDKAITEFHGKKFPRTLTSSRVLKQDGYHDRVICGTHSEGVAETEEHFFYESAMDFIKKSKENSDKPWFTFISTNAPHDPYLAPEELMNLYDVDKMEIPQSYYDQMLDKPSIYRRCKEVWKDLSEDDVKKIIACYYAYNTLIDRLVGNMLDYLKESNQLENTLIVYLSDHGDMMGAHGLFCKGIPAFDETYRIPLIMSYKGKIPNACISKQKISMVDIAPTVLDFAGLSALENTDGESLAKKIANNNSIKERSIYAEFYGQRLSCSQRILWKDNYKYVFNGFDFDELYDLEKDPKETINLNKSQNHEVVRKDMAREMWNIAKNTGDACFIDAEYFMFRFLPVGPESSSYQSIYNRGA